MDWGGKELTLCVRYIGGKCEFKPYKLWNAQIYFRQKNVVKNLKLRNLQTTHLDLKSKLTIQCTYELMWKMVTH